MVCFFYVIWNELYIGFEKRLKKEMFENPIKN